MVLFNLPKEVPSLVFDNVTQLIVYLPTHSPTMRRHFDTEAIKKFYLENMILI